MKSLYYDLWPTIYTLLQKGESILRIWGPKITLVRSSFSQFMDAFKLTITSNHLPFFGETFYFFVLSLLNWVFRLVSGWKQHIFVFIVWNVYCTISVDFKNISKYFFSSITAPLYINYSKYHKLTTFSKDQTIRSLRK